MARAAPELTGTRIRERRLALARRQADLARAVGISAAYLNLIEHNRRPVGPDLIARLALELQVPADELAAGREEARLTALREAASHPIAAASVPELDHSPEFLARFPGWAALLIAQARRGDGLERQLIDLSDRMTRDPYLLATLHEVLSAVTSVRATASILVEEGPISDDWRRRFHANLHQDSQRLSRTAQALVAYLDSFEAEGQPATPTEEVEAWAERARGGLPDPGDLTSDAARAMGRQVLAEMQDDRARLPDRMLADAGDTDPLRIAARLDLPADLVLRRLADLRPDGFHGAGLIVCDGGGALICRRQAQGFALARPGDACALWPLYQALSVPQTMLAQTVATPDGRAFRTMSFARRHQPQGLDGPWLTHATMLIVPLDGPPPADARPIGPACRICPRQDCVARREPSILTDDPRQTSL